MKSRLLGAVPDPVKQGFADLARDRTWAYRLKVRYLSWKCDTFLISFPKCGRTWLRVMLGKAMRDRYELRGHNLMRFTDAGVDAAGVPRILATHDDSPQVKAPEHLIRQKSPYRRRRVLFLARDPRDVVVSLYFHRTRRRRDPYPGSLSDFLTERVGSFDALLAFYNIWAEQRHVPAAFELLRYEDLRDDPGAGFRRVLDFVGLGDVSDEVAERAVEFASFERMQRREREGTARSRAVRTADASDPASYKARRGVVGGYVDELAPAEIDDLTHRMAQLDPIFGYR